MMVRGKSRGRETYQISPFPPCKSTEVASLSSPASHISFLLKIIFKSYLLVFKQGVFKWFIPDTSLDQVHVWAIAQRYLDSEFLPGWLLQLGPWDAPLWCWSQGCLLSSKTWPRWGHPAGEAPLKSSPSIWKRAGRRGSLCLSHPQAQFLSSCWFSISEYLVSPAFSLGAPPPKKSVEVNGILRVGFARLDRSLCKVGFLVNK